MSNRKEMRWRTVEGSFASHYEQLMACASSQINHKLVAAMLRSESCVNAVVVVGLILRRARLLQHGVERAAPRPTGLRPQEDHR